uniref:Poly (ADP-ribose) polymerase family, member 3 n=1 Tax=Takifugu rubripes TaxID=31033 RepID=A0A674NQ20_TAKRU
MPPKRRAASAARAGGKKAKEETSEPKDAFTSAKEALLAAGPQVKGRRKVDEHCQVSASAEVHEDYDCMLNQTNIGQNNNKFYVIQVIKDNNRFYSWNRWGRVGEVGQSKLSPFDKLEKAVKDFEKKFKDKTKNSWSDRSNFVSYAGKYTMIEVDGEQDAEVKVGPKKLWSKKRDAHGEIILKSPRRLQQRLTSFFLLRAKVLADIELAQTLKSETEKAQEEMIETVPHPLDQDYNSLRCRPESAGTQRQKHLRYHLMRSSYMATPGMRCWVLRLCCSSARHKGTFIVFCWY